jgi:hypothetical protein
VVPEAGILGTITQIVVDELFIPDSTQCPNRFPELSTNRRSAPEAANSPAEIMLAVSMLMLTE